MVAVPTATPVTTPDALTVATDSSELVHVGVRPEVLVPVIVAVRVVVRPTPTLADVGLSVMPVTEAPFWSTETVL